MTHQEDPIRRFRETTVRVDQEDTGALITFCPVESAAEGS